MDQGLEGTVTLVAKCPRVGRRLGVHPGPRGRSSPVGWYPSRDVTGLDLRGPRDEYPKPGESYCEPCEPSGYPIRIPIPRIPQRSIPRTVGAWKILEREEFVPVPSFGMALAREDAARDTRTGP